MRLPIAAPTGSSLWLGIMCRYPWTSGLWQEREREDTPEMSYGRAGHWAAEEMVCGMAESANWRSDAAHLFPHLARMAAERHGVPESDHQRLAWDIRAVHRQLLRDAQGGTLHAEQGFAYDLHTGEVHDVEREPGEPGPAGWLSLLVDLVIFHADDNAITVRDWKFGRGPTEWPRHNAQLLLGGLCLQLLHPEAAITLESAVVSEGECYIRRARVSVDELGHFAEALDLVRQDLGSDPRPRPGPWCRRCPVAIQCPATVALYDPLADDFEINYQGGPRTPEQVARIWGWLPAARAWLEHLEGQIAGAVHVLGPVPLGPGLELRSVVSRGSSRVQTDERALAAIEEVVRRHAPDEETAARAVRRAVEVTEAKVTLKSLSAGLAHIWAPGERRKGEDGKTISRKDWLAQVRQELREAGAIRKGAPSYRVEECAAREEDGDG